MVGEHTYDLHPWPVFCICLVVGSGPGLDVFRCQGGLGGGGAVFRSWSGCFGCVVVRVHWVLSDLGLGGGGIGGGSGLSYYFIYVFNIIFRSLWLCAVFLWLVLGVGHFIILW